MAFYFKAFGLNIRSEYPFRGSPPDEKGIFDVDCIKGIVPKTLAVSKVKGINFESNDQEFLLKVENVAHFLITNGNKVVVQEYEEVELREIELFFLGSVMAALIMQRGIIPFHGSAFVKGDKAIIFSGHSGTGKSSLLSYVVRQGYKALTDDVCALSVDANNRVVLTPSYPSAKIWADIMDKMQFKKLKKDNVRPCIEKYRRDYTQNFCSTSKVVDSIYVLNSHNDNKFLSSSIKGLEKFKLLNDNLYRPKYPEATGKEQETFKLINLLAQQAKVYTMTRSNDLHDFEKFNEFALHQILKDA